MRFLVEGELVESVAIIDDDEEARDTLEIELQNLKLELRAMSLEGPFDTPEAALHEVAMYSNVAICDHHLSQSSHYATFNGAKLVSYCYDHKFPSLLVTRYTKDILFEIRPYRSRIPVLFSPDQVKDLDQLKRGIEECIKEVKYGKFSPGRRAWRTMIRVEDVSYETDSAYVIMTDWDGPEGKDGIKLPLSMIPTELLQNLKPNTRLFAMANLGAEREEDLYIHKFRLD